MRVLWELPKASDTTIREFYDKLELYVRGLRALGKEEDSYGDLLVPVVTDRLPPKMRTHINREQGDSAWSLRQLLDAIYREIQADDSEEALSYEPSAAAFHISSKGHRRGGSTSQQPHSGGHQTYHKGSQKAKGV